MMSLACTAAKGGWAGGRGYITITDTNNYVLPAKAGPKRAT